MDTIPHDPTAGIYPSPPDYVHALEVRGATGTLYVAGTMGLDAQGAAGADLAIRVALVWRNIRTILAAAGMAVRKIVRITSYLRDVSYAEANAAARIAALDGRVVPTAVTAAA